MKTHLIAAMLVSSLALAGTASAQRAPRTSDVSILFTFDSSKLDPADLIAVWTAANWLHAHPGYRLVVEGNTDSTGGAIYNVGLASRRARIVREGILAYGLARDRVIATVYGEANPSGHSDSSNRRVLMYATRQSNAEIVTDTLRRGYAIIWG